MILSLAIQFLEKYFINNVMINFSLANQVLMKFPTRNEILEKIFTRTSFHKKLKIFKADTLVTETLTKTLTIPPVLHFFQRAIECESAAFCRSCVLKECYRVQDNFVHVAAP